MVADSQFNWSESPGAFEQYLMRRCNSYFFPKERRHVTQAEIDKAQALDLIDSEIVRKKLEEVLNEMAGLTGNLPLRTLDPYRKRLDDLIEESTGIGGRALEIADFAKQARANVSKALGEGCASNPELRDALQKAEGNHYQGRGWFLIPFVAQMLRKDGPIPNSEVVPALLTEDPDTISQVFQRMDPKVQTMMQQSAKEILARAVREGASIDKMEEKLKAFCIPP